LLPLFNRKHGPLLATLLHPPTTVALQAA
jgi:hypothetical protein